MRWNHFKSIHSCRKLRNGDERRKRQNGRGSAARLEFDSFKGILLFAVAVGAARKARFLQKQHRRFVIHARRKKENRNRAGYALRQTHHSFHSFVRLSHRNRDESKLVMRQKITILSFALQSRLVNRTWARLAKSTPWDSLQKKTSRSLAGANFYVHAKLELIWIFFHFNLCSKAHFQFQLHFRSAI